MGLYIKNSKNIAYFKNTSFSKKRPAGGSAANEGRVHFQKNFIFKKNTRRRQRRQRMESLLPRDLLSITPRPIID